MASLSTDLPTPAEVAPWVEAIVRLWDSPEEYEERSRRARVEARRWSADLLEPRYEAFFRSVVAGRAGDVRSGDSCLTRVGPDGSDGVRLESLTYDGRIGYTPEG